MIIIVLFQSESLGQNSLPSQAISWHYLLEITLYSFQLALEGLYLLTVDGYKGKIVDSLV